MTTKYPRLNHRHIHVMKWLLDHPAATLTECAKNIGYSRSWLSRIVNAPDFRTEYYNLLDAELNRAVKKSLGLTTKRNCDNF